MAQQIVDVITKELIHEGQPGSDDPARLARFFQAHPGGYGEGDQFIGIKVPPIRRVAKIHRNMSFDDLAQLLASPLHEVRLLAAIILNNQTHRADLATRKRIFDFYLSHTKSINNWDIVDLSCRDVVGGYIFLQPEARPVLTKLAHSPDMWERRIAMVSTWYQIREKQLDDTFEIATILLHDKQDLIHKAVGWMLREAGKRDEAPLKAFLDKHAATMPRTALRYALERLSPEDKVHYMKLKAVA